MRINKCPYCKDNLKVSKVHCHKCGISFEGEFYTTPIMGLSEEEQSFVELFVLSSGSLKEMASMLNVTYPTVRTRLDHIIKNLKNEMKNREEFKEEILNRVETGKLSAEKAAEVLRSL